MPAITASKAMRSEKASQHLHSYDTHMQTAVFTNGLGYAFLSGSSITSLFANDFLTFTHMSHTVESGRNALYD